MRHLRHLGHEQVEEDIYRQESDADASTLEVVGVDRR